ncbi:MAG: porin [Acidobacteriota bacterium]
MRRTLLVVAALVLVASFAGIAHAQEEDPSGFKVFWRDGLRMETNDGQFQLRFGGRIQYDWTVWGDDSEVADAVAGEILNGTEFRRARIFVQGYVYEKFEYKLQIDFAGGEAAIKDLYFGIRNPVYGFRMGHMKEPFSLEELTSSKYITFIERGLPAVFDSERNSGFMLHGNIIGGNWNYGVGFFRDTGDNGIGVEPKGYNLSGRFAGALINRDGGRQVVHVGASAVFRNAENRPNVFRQRPEVHLSPRFISSGPLVIDGISVIGVEAAVVSGPFSAQGEYKVAPVNSVESGDPTFTGWYVYGSYFLTGESRAYSDSLFHRLRPNRNFLENGGLGAFEVALRYSTLDLGVDEVVKPDDPIQGTKLDDVTFGLNWYWNPMTLMRFNLVRADIVDIGSIWAFVWRGQIEW